jgi:hypothetical protein
MSAIAKDMARLLWWYLLWVMRRPWMKRLQKGWLNWVREAKRQGAAESVKKQNRWARRFGLPLLTLAMNLLLVSVILTVAYLTAINLYEAGAFSVPTTPQTSQLQPQMGTSLLGTALLLPT